MRLLEEIRKSDKKPKELLVYLSGLIQKDKTVLDGFENILQNTTDVERGICIEAMEYVTQKNPEIVLPYLKTIIVALSDKAPRAKWEAARIIGNIASKYPEKAALALDNLIINTKDKGTVVRWSAAFALGEILKSKSALKLKIEELVKKESNTGVKNVYLKAVKGQ